MTFRLFLFLALGLSVSSCVTQKLPDAAAMDRYYQFAAELNRDKVQELETRRASGLIDSVTYQREKAALDAEIGKKAMDLAWTRHDLNESKLESMGLPTPDHPQSISVPEAGGLPTGGGYRRFNDNLNLGGGGESSQAMRSAAMGGSPGLNIRH